MNRIEVLKRLPHWAGKMTITNPLRIDFKLFVRPLDQGELQNTDRQDNPKQNNWSLLAKELISADDGNALRLGSDNKLYLNPLTKQDW